MRAEMFADFVQEWPLTGEEDVVELRVRGRDVKPCSHGPGRTDHSGRMSAAFAPGCLVERCIITRLDFRNRVWPQAPEFDLP